MALADVYQEATPASTDDPREGDDRIRELKRAIRERATQGGIYFENSGTIDQDGGKICAGIQATNLLTFYMTDKTADMMLFNDSTLVATLGDGKAGSNAWSLVVDNIDVDSIATDAAIVVGTDLSVGGDLTVTGDVDEVSIVGGTTDRAYTQAQDATDFIISTANSVPVTTPTITTSKGTGGVTRLFQVCFSAVYVTIAGSGIIPSIYTRLEYDHDGTGWSTILNSVRAITGSNSWANGGGHLQTFSNILALSTNAQTLRVRAWVENNSGGNELVLYSPTMYLYEVM
jgi:hypothetical protein